MVGDYHCLYMAKSGETAPSVVAKGLAVKQETGIYRALADLSKSGKAC